MPYKFAGTHLQVYLKTGIAELDECVLESKLQFVKPLDLYDPILAVQHRNNAVDLVVSGKRSQVFDSEI